LIIATLRMLYGFEPLTPRDAAAPDLLGALQPEPDNDGPPTVAEPFIPDASDVAAAAAARPPNSLQSSLARPTNSGGGHCSAYQADERSARCGREIQYGR
jgi:hypothetical protein